MKKITSNLIWIFSLLFVFSSQNHLSAQGTVTFVTPNNSVIGDTITLNISGSGTVFSVGTTSLTNSSSWAIMPTSIIVNNDSSMQATFIIPNNLLYVGLWDVNAGLASPLVNGFEITSNMVTIEGVAYYDSNTNCILDPIDQRLYNRYVLFQPGSIYASVDVNGFYTMEVPTGFYTGTLTYVQNYSWEGVSCPITGDYTINIASATPYTISNQNFGTNYTDTCARMKTDIASLNMRPCFIHETYITYQNLTPFFATNTVVEVTLDNFLTPVFSFPAWSTQVGNVLTFNVGNVAPFAYEYIYLYDSVSCLAPLGNILCIDAMTTVTPTTCFDSVDNYMNYCAPTTLAYDPNDKQTILPQTTLIEATDELKYMIRFQNTGTDTAFTVVILDTLPANLLPSTLIPGVSSHPFTYNVSGTGLLEFTFNNILLPDSTASEPESHGFVTFSIRQQPGNPPGTQIMNTAGIYFDFNAPVITNTTFNEIAIPANVEEQNMDQKSIATYPNPFTTSTRFSFMNKDVKSIYSITLFDVTGKVVKEIKNITGLSYDLERGDLAPQVYFYMVQESDKQIGVGKLVILSK